ncbi:MAG TPA: PspA/IM30 family protein [Armatimonadota bacterium]|nr:PspA/IM30 family protein [Armatimonadota bacterium]HPT97068.1 PspA/IM30 family protein [Armatimonadota bacterium]
MLQRIWRVILSVITLGLVKLETPELVGDQLIEEMEAKERKLAEDAIGVVAYQKRLEAELAQAEKDLATWTNRAKAAARAGDQEVGIHAMEQVTRLEANIQRLQESVAVARDRSRQAMDALERFKAQVASARERVKDLKARDRLARLESNASRAMTGYDLNAQMKQLDRMSEQVAEREARARATTEIASNDINVRIQRAEMDAQRAEAANRFAELQAEVAGTGEAQAAPPVPEAEGGRQL